MDGKTEKLKFTLTKGHLPFLLPLKESGREASKEQASHSTDKNKILEISLMTNISHPSKINFFYVSLIVS